MQQYRHIIFEYVCNNLFLYQKHHYMYNVSVHYICNCVSPDRDHIRVIMIFVERILDLILDLFCIADIIFHVLLINEQKAHLA
jgi:hypothetical protein